MLDIDGPEGENGKVSSEFSDEAGIIAVTDAGEDVAESKHHNEPEATNDGEAMAGLMTAAPVEHRVTGDPLEEETEEQRKRRKEKLDKFNEELEAEFDAEAAEAEGKAGMLADGEGGAWRCERV